MTGERTDGRIDPKAGAALKRRGILAAAGATVAGIVAKRTSEPVLAVPDANFVATGGYSTGISATGTTYALYGSTGSGSAGVYGGGPTGVHGVGGATGVHGESPAIAGIGVRGEIPAFVGSGIPMPNTAPNTIAVQGINQSSGAKCDAGYGVLGGSTGGIGVFGSTNGSGQVAGVYGVSDHAYGIIGNSTAAGYSGLTAITGTAGVAALAATSTVPTAFAAYFQGATTVQGNFTVFGGSKSAAVPHPDGSHRLVYCVESPEAWFEDFGKGQLAGGKADVRLDADFAAIVHADDYLVFLTPMGECKGLAVTSQNAGGFTVRELQAGTSGTAFAWRVVARRKDTTGKRLAKFALPKINHPDPDKLPRP